MKPLQSIYFLYYKLIDLREKRNGEITKPFTQNRDVTSDDYGWHGEIDGKPFHIFRDTEQFGYGVWYEEGRDTTLGSTKKEAIENLQRRMRQTPVQEPEGVEGKTEVAEPATKTAPATKPDKISAKPEKEIKFWSYDKDHMGEPTRYSDSYVPTLEDAKLWQEQVEI